MCATEQYMYNGRKVISNIDIQRTNGEVHLSCTIHSKHKTNTYLDAFSDLIEHCVYRMEDCTEYQDGYLDGYKQGKNAALEEIKNTVAKGE